MTIQACPKDNQELEALLATPSEQLIQAMAKLDGDIIILGIAGKIGPTVGQMAVKATKLAGKKRRIFGVSRFSGKGTQAQLKEAGISTIPCDLLDRKSVEKLPKPPNVLFLAGRKFGTEGAASETWAMNVLVPAIVAETFSDSRIVSASTGCVYPLVAASTGGCTEDVPPEPIGEYSQSCLGRERMFDYWCQRNNSKLLHYRLNYAIDLRYGVLHDIAQKVLHGQPVDLTVGHFNVIWQGDAADVMLRSLEFCDNPPRILNVTGPEIVSTEETARQFAKIFGKEPTFVGSDADSCYLSNAAKMVKIFGKPRVALEQLIQWQADWLLKGGESYGKPTHFEVNNGKF